MHTYALYCAAVQSSVFLEDLRPLSARDWASHPTKLVFRFEEGEEPQGLDWKPYPHRAPLRSLEVQHRLESGRTLFRLEYVGVRCRFTIDPAAGAVHGYGREADPAVLQRLMTGPVAGLLLRLRGFFALHASVSEIDGRAVAFVADAGLGKTTAAVECARRGWRTVADDVLLLTEETSDSRTWMANPGPRSRHMWAETLQAFGDASDHAAHYPPIHPGTRKKYVDHGRFGRTSFIDDPQPLHDLIFLEEFRAETRKVRLEPLTPIDALGRILRNRYGLIDTPPEMRARELAQAQRLIAGVRCLRAIRPPATDAYRSLVDAVQSLP